MSLRTLRSLPTRGLRWLAVVALSTLAACGQKGPLTLPDRPPAATSRPPANAPAEDDDREQDDER